MTTLDDTRVLVTGAGGGIGAAIAREVAHRNAVVAVTDLDLAAAESVAEAIVADGGTAHAYQLDVTDQSAIEAVTSTTEQKIGPLNAWVNNAGVSTMAPFTEITEEDLDLMLAVNTKGVFLCGQVAAKRLRTNGGGRIVNIASMASKAGAAPFLAHYVASKFAVVGLTQTMAAELGRDGITVNSVCPGFVATSMQQRELQWEADLKGVTPDDVRRMMIEDTPLGRIETPEDVARSVAFLLSDDAAFITGEALAVNGGAFMD